MRKAINQVLTVFKYLIAVFMMYAGIATMFIPPESGSKLGFIYENRWALVAFGCVFFASGLVLLIGKIRKSDRLTGNGLFMIYGCFLFSFVLNWVAFDFSASWGNLIGAVVVGALYLRWKYHIYYTDGLDRVRKARYSGTTTE